MSTNSDKYQKLERTSGVSDHSKPHGPLQKLIANHYAITLGVLTGITVYLATRVKHIWWPGFWIHMAAGSIYGWTWNYYITVIDPTISGWMYHPWAWTGIGFGEMVGLDVLFYPVCGGMFFFIKELLPDTKLRSNRAKRTALILSALTVLVWAYISEIGGTSIACWFAVPGLGMMLISWKRWDVGKWLVMGVIVVGFAGVWDLINSTVLVEIWPWADGWRYRFTDATGDPIHSFVWLSIRRHPWAWIGRSPIEITPWFGIAGWFFTFSLADVCLMMRRHSPPV